MRPGSVVVDLAAGSLGGNVDGSQPDRRVVTEESVTLIGAGNLPSEMAPAASVAYSRNVVATLTHLLSDGAPAIDLSDEIQSAIVLTHDGAVVNPPLPATLLGGTR
jgi:NAD(P) transhydrogenase subunit alpha